MDSTTTARAAFDDLVARTDPLSDAELDELFGGLGGIEFGANALAALLRGDPRTVLQRVGAGRAARASARVARGWIRAGLEG